jgi:hypothetical protein
MEASRVIIMPGLHKDRDSTKERQTVQKTDNPETVANTLWAKRYKRLTIFCEHAVAVAVTCPGSDAQPSKEQDAHGQEKMMTSHEIEMPAYNIRIRIPHDAYDDSGEDDMEEDEDVPDRDQVKKYSSLTVFDKANKKQRRKRKRKTGEGGSDGGSKGSKSGGKRPEESVEESVEWPDMSTILYSPDLFTPAIVSSFWSVFAEYHSDIAEYRN